MANALETAGFGQIGESPTPSSLSDALARRPRTRIALDNFEQLVATSTLAVKELLSLTPGLQLVVTSRERLQLSLEHVFALGPLPMPAAGGAEESAAVNLLVSRARRLRRDFALPDKNRAGLLAIVRRLEGIPLALELAAPRLAMMGTATLLSRLDDTLSLFGGREARRSPRSNRNVLAAIDGRRTERANAVLTLRGWIRARGSRADSRLNDLHPVDAGAVALGEITLADEPQRPLQHAGEYSRIRARERQRSQPRLSAPCRLLRNARL